MKRFAEKYPDDKRSTEAMFRSARAAVQAEKLDNAVAAYKQIASSTRTAEVREEALYCLGLAYLEADETEKIIETFSNVLKEFPRTDHADEIYYTLGRIYLLEGKYERAVANLENVGKKDIKSPYGGSALADLGYAYLRQERHDDAARALVKVVRSYPEIALTEQAYLWLGEHLFEKDEFDGAAQVFAALAEAGPKGQHAGLARLRIAQCNLNSNHLDAAKRGFESVLADFREYYGADAEYGIGVCLAKEGKYDDALQHLSIVLEQDEGETAARAQMEVGNIYSARKDFDAASKAYLRVALLYDHHELTPESLFKAAQCLEKAGKSTEAMEFYKELTERYPDSSYAARAREMIGVT